MLTILICLKNKNATSIVFTSLCISDDPSMSCLSPNQVINVLHIFMSSIHSKFFNHVPIPKFLSPYSKELWSLYMNGLIDPYLSILQEQFAPFELSPIFKMIGIHRDPNFTL